MTNKSLIPVLAVGVLIASIGLICFFFPNWVRRFDTRMKRFIPNKTDYLSSVRIFGIVFFMISVLFIVFIVELYFLGF